jgi:NAD(P)-dependent dehydrogenase (short-subunit alcohol dehydrogenase family)/catechol 2,3-dioxygenase-like lactoylglutathione lyase family enzyme
MSDLPRMDGRTVLITGANSGIGFEAAAGLAALGAEVVLAVRDLAKGERARQQILDRTGMDPQVVHLDLADLVSVRRCASEVLDRFPRLHVLVCNAGLTLSARSETAQGIEYLFGVNHLGHFVLVDLLRQRLVDSAPARVVVVSSDMHRIAYRGLAFDDLQSTRRYVSYDVYGKTKLANILFTRELARRLDGTGVTANAMHPGLVKTNFGGEGDTRLTQRFVRMLPRQLAIDAAKGADTIVYLAASDDVETETGGYWVNRRRTEPSPQAGDDAAAARLWEVSEALVSGLDTEPEPFGAEGPVRVVLVPADHEALVAFYRDTLGFPQVLDTRDPDGSVVVRVSAGCLLELVRERDAAPQGLALDVEVASAEAARRQLRRRQVPTSALVDDAGRLWFEITDPEGNHLRYFERT